MIFNTSIMRIQIFSRALRLRLTFPTILSVMALPSEKSPHLILIEQSYLSMNQISNYEFFFGGEFLSLRP